MGSSKMGTTVAGPNMRMTVTFLLAMTVMLVNNGIGVRGVAAFQSSSPQHQGGNQNNKNTGRHQRYPVRSKTFEPRTTEFPKTTTPSDGNDRKNGMFSPMDPNDPRRRKKKRRQAQKVIKSIWETSAPMLVEASSLHTVDFEEPSTERVQVLLKKSGMDPISGNRKTTREPLIARVDLWHGPDSTPQNLAIYLEDDDEDDDIPHYEDDDYDENGRFYGETNTGSCDTPFTTIIETPYGHNTVAIRNIAESSDLLTHVQGEENENWYKPSSPPSTDSPLQSVVQRLKATTTPQRIDSTSARNTGNEDDDGEEGNKAVVGSCTVELPSKIASVQVLLQTDFMQPIQARIELELRVTDEASRATPGSDYRVVKRTIVEVYSEDGMHRPFFAVLETPRKTKRRQRGEQGWFGNNKATYSTSMKVVNLSTTEFPLFATVEPHEIDDLFEEEDEEISSASEPSESEDDDSTTHGQEWTHFGGGSNYDLSSNSTILDAEIL